MRRVLVPLDGTETGTAVLADARRMAGIDGRLILVRDATTPTYRRAVEGGADLKDVQIVSDYLEAQATELRRQGVDVESHTLVLLDPVFAIQEAVDLYDVDMVACATHGRTPLGRLVRGGTVWKALAHSSVPVLLRHPEKQNEVESIFAEPRRIMVPLDGSVYAEKAIPLAVELAEEWDADLLLVRVAPLPQPAYPFITLSGGPDPQVAGADSYLREVAASLTVPVQTRILVGNVVDDLTAIVRCDAVTDIVMASHGRTGLARAVLGSVTDALVHRLHVPIIVIPALAAEAVQTVPIERATQQRELAPIVS